MTLKETGEALGGISPERVRQRKIEGLKKLRRSRAIRELYSNSITYTPRSAAACLRIGSTVETDTERREKLLRLISKWRSNFPQSEKVYRETRGGLSTAQNLAVLNARYTAKSSILHSQFAVYSKLRRRNLIHWKWCPLWPTPFHLHQALKRTIHFWIYLERNQISFVFLQLRKRPHLWGDKDFSQSKKPCNFAFTV